MAKKSMTLQSRIGSKVSKTPVKSKKDNPLLARINGAPTSKKTQNNKQINPLLKALRNDKPNKSIQQKKATPRENLINVIKSSTHQRYLKHSAASNYAKAPTVLKIKNASTPNFLKIKNLERGTTANDVVSVLEPIGEVSIIKVNNLPSGSAIAEVVFTNSQHLGNAVKFLNGAIADGRVLEALVTNESETNILAGSQQSRTQQTKNQPNSSQNKQNRANQTSNQRDKSKQRSKSLVERIRA